MRLKSGSVMTNLIILDFDGTIINTVPLVTEILNCLRSRRGLPLLTLSDVRPWISQGGIPMISNCLSVSDVEARKYLDEFRGIYFNTPTPLNLVYNWVFDFLNFAAESAYELAVCSNKPEELLNKALRDTNLAKFFSLTVGGTGTTRAKPHPDRLLAILKTLECKHDNAIMIGDSSIDQQTCRSASVNFILFQGGYDDGVRLKSPDCAFLHFTELKDILNGKQDFACSSII